MKKLNSYVYFSIAVSIVMLFLGGICVFKPDLSFEIVTGILVGLFIITGVCLLIFDYRYRSIVMSNFFYGTFSIIVGLVIWVHPDMIIILLPVGVGIWFIMSALFNVRFAKYFKTESTTFAIMSVICDIVAIACGVFLIANPLETSGILMSTLGFTLAFYSLANVLDMLIIKKYVDRIFKNIKKYIAEFSK